LCLPPNRPTAIAELENRPFPDYFFHLKSYFFNI
jgi:hypothetical protein